MYYLERGVWPGPDGDPMEVQQMSSGLLLEVPQSKYWKYQFHHHAEGRGDVRASLLDTKWKLKKGNNEYIGIEIKTYADGSRDYSYCIPGGCSYDNSSSGWKN